MKYIIRKFTLFFPKEFKEGSGGPGVKNADRNLRCLNQFHLRSSEQCCVYAGNSHVRSAGSKILACRKVNGMGAGCELLQTSNPGREKLDQN